MTHDWAQESAISWKHLGIALTLVLSVLCLSIGSAILANSWRREQVVQQYTQEISDFSQKNPIYFPELFGSVLSACPEIYENTIKNKPQTTNVTCPAAVEFFNKTTGLPWKDFSATAFLRTEPNSTISLLEASGSYQQIQVRDSSYLNWSSRRPTRELIEYILEGKPLQSSWADFVPYLPGKEVVIPIVVQGKTLGFLLRSVIER